MVLVCDQFVFVLCSWFTGCDTNPSSMVTNLQQSVCEIAMGSLPLSESNHAADSLLYKINGLLIPSFFRNPAKCFIWENTMNVPWGSLVQQVLVSGILFFIIHSFIHWFIHWFIHSFTAASYFHPFQKVPVCCALLLAVMHGGAYFFCAIKCRTLQGTLHCQPRVLGPGMASAQLGANQVQTLAGIRDVYHF